MRAPLIATFLPQILLSLALGVAIIAMFASMHSSAITTTMENSVKDSLRFAEQRLAAPFTRLVYDTRLVKEQIAMHNAFAWRENQPGPRPTSLEVYRPFIEMCQQLIRINNGSYAFVYQATRYTDPYPTATNSPLDNQDFGWGATGSGYDYSMNMVNYTTFNLFNLGVDQTYPVMDLANIVANPPEDHRLTSYAQAVAKLTNSTEDREGEWGDVEMWVDQFDGTGKITLYVLYTYSIPLTWDPITGQATSAISIDMDCATWLVRYVKGLNIQSTELSLIEPRSFQVLATTFSTLEPGYERPNVSDASSYRLWKPLTSPEGRLTAAMEAIAAEAKTAWTTLPAEGVLTLPKGSDDIYGTRPIREAGLKLIIVSVTDKDYYFAEGHATQRDSIIISAVLLLTIIAVAVVTAGMIRKPLDRLGERMAKTASLDDDEEEDALSSVAEIAKMQTAYATMLAELKRVKSYLPQSVLARLNSSENDDDDDEFSEDGGSEADSSKKPRTMSREGSVHSRATRLSNSSMDSSTNRSVTGVGGTRGALNMSNTMIQKTVCVAHLNLSGFHQHVNEKPVGEIRRMQTKYLDTITGVMKDWRGVVDFFQGDHVVVSWNAVTNATTTVKRAITSLVQISTQLRDAELPRLAAGVSWGRALVGNSGSVGMQRFNIIGRVYGNAGKLMACATEQLQRNPEMRHRLLMDRSMIAEGAIVSRFYGCGVAPLLKAGTVEPIYAIAALTEAGPTDEWMYELENRAGSDPFAMLNDAYEKAFTGSEDQAREIVTTLPKNMDGVAALSEFLERQQK